MLDDINFFKEGWIKTAYWKVANVVINCPMRSSWWQVFDEKCLLKINWKLNKKMSTIQSNQSISHIYLEKLQIIITLIEHVEI